MKHFRVFSFDEESYNVQKFILLISKMAAKMAACDTNVLNIDRGYKINSP